MYSFWAGKTNYVQFPLHKSHLRTSHIIEEIYNLAMFYTRTPFLGQYRLCQNYLLFSFLFANQVLCQNLIINMNLFHATTVFPFENFWSWSCLYYKFMDYFASNRGNLQTVHPQANEIYSTINVIYSLKI